MNKSLFTKGNVLFFSGLIFIIVAFFLLQEKNVTTAILSLVAGVLNVINSNEAYKNEKINL